jgi:hypothetical protein
MMNRNFSRYNFFTSDCFTYGLNFTSYFAMGFYLGCVGFKNKKDRSLKTVPAAIFFGLGCITHGLLKIKLR